METRQLRLACNEHFPLGWESCTKYVFINILVLYSDLLNYCCQRVRTDFEPHGPVGLLDYLLEVKSVAWCFQHGVTRQNVASTVAAVNGTFTKTC